jgi:nicotinate phosphoribosyltransferase
MTAGVPWIGPSNAPLLTDLYELTMADAYLAEGLEHQATFELFVRRLPESRNFLVAAGIDDAVTFLEGLRFDAAALDGLRSLGRFSGQLIEHLAGLRFTGDVHAVREGEVVFAGEPLLRVTAPLIQAQIVETFLLNAVLFQAMIASKAARVTIACAGRPFADFSARRDHGADAALRAARAAFIGGAASTSNVAAGLAYAIPLSGTMAHSFVMSFDDEAAAFRAYARRFGAASVLLIDTYDVLEGARVAARVSAEFLESGIELAGVRLDSGDLVQGSKDVRAILDAAGQSHLRIFASGDLDEWAISRLLAAGAPIDSFGVGTRLGTSEDAPSLSGVYKLVADAAGSRMKLSAGKATLPGAKQIYRMFVDGMAERDVLALEAEEVAGGQALSRPVIVGGERVAAPATLAEARQRCAASIASLPERLRSLDASEPYPVELSPALEALNTSTAAIAHSRRLARIEP